MKKAVMKSLMSLVFNGGIREDNKDVFGKEVLETLNFLGKPDPVFSEIDGVLYITMERGCQQLAISYSMDELTWCVFYTQFDSEDPESRQSLIELSSAVTDKTVTDHEQWFDEPLISKLAHVLSPIVAPMTVEDYIPDLV